MSRGGRQVDSSRARLGRRIWFWMLYVSLLGLVVRFLPQLEAALAFLLTSNLTALFVWGGWTHGGRLAVSFGRGHPVNQLIAISGCAPGCLFLLSYPLLFGLLQVVAAVDASLRGGGGRVADTGWTIWVWFATPIVLMVVIVDSFTPPPNALEQKVNDPDRDGG